MRGQPFRRTHLFAVRAAGYVDLSRELGKEVLRETLLQLVVEFVELAVSPEDDCGRVGGGIDASDLDLVHLDIRNAHTRANDRERQTVGYTSSSFQCAGTHTHTHTHRQRTYNILLRIKPHVIGNHHCGQYLCISSNTR